LAFLYVNFLTPRASDCLHLPVAGSEPVAFWFEHHLPLHAFRWQLVVQSLVIGAYLTAVTAVSGPETVGLFPYTFAVILICDPLVVESIRLSTSFALQALLAVAALGLTANPPLIVVSFIAAAVCLIQRAEFIALLIVLPAALHGGRKWAVPGVAAAAAVVVACDGAVGFPALRTSWALPRRLRRLWATDQNLLIVVATPAAITCCARAGGVPWLLIGGVVVAAFLVFIVPFESERDAELAAVAVVRILAHVLCGSLAAKQKGPGEVILTVLAGIAVVQRIVSTWRGTRSAGESFAA
jgi:hypothetical protein